jgi:hypothetical protein
MEGREEPHTDKYMWIIKSGRMRWAEHVACMGKLEMLTKFLFGCLKGMEGKRLLGRTRQI